MIILSFLLSFFVAIGCTPVVIHLYRSLGWIDDPTSKKHAKVIHKTPVPRGGGVVIFASVLLATVLTFQLSPQITAILLSAFILTVVGIFDDIFDITPYIRLTMGFVVGLIIVMSGISIQYITNPFGEGVLFFNLLEMPWIQELTGTSGLSVVLTVLWIVWNMNIVNWSKGLDGQLPGVVGIAALFIGLLAARLNDPAQLPVVQLSMVVSGAFLGFLIWNKYPQKIMPGYGAGSLGGFFLAVLAILSGAKLATALLVLAVPTADAVFTILRRIARKKSPFWGDRGHLHHKLYDVLGWSKPQIAMFYWITTAIMGVIALQLKPEQKLFTITAVTALVFGFLIWAKLFISFSKQPDQDNG